MSDDLARVRERIRQTRENLIEMNSPLPDTTRPEHAGRVGSFLAGDRVFDTVSGREGVIVATERARGPVVDRISVDLGGGDIVVRHCDELVLRPPRPGKDR